MRQLLLAMGLVLFSASPALAQGGDPDARVTQVDSSAYPKLTLYVSVNDAAGQPLSNLRREDFQLREDGQPVTLEDFAGGGGGPIATALLIDRSGSMQDAGKIEGAQDAARVFVEQMRPGDRSALIGFNSTPALIYDFTDARPMLDDGIQSLEPRGGTALYDSIIAGVDALRSQSGRHVLLLLTDGQDCREQNACSDAAGSRHSLEQAIAYARRYDQPVQVIGVGDQGGSDRDGIDERVLRQIARETGGQYLYAPEADQLSALYAGLSGGLHSEYRLSYRSPRPFYDGTRRQIDVAVGGAAPSSAGYVEQHLINVQSAPGLGIAFLLPLLLLLLLPLLWQRRRRAAVIPVVTSQVSVLHTNDEQRICAHCGGALRAESRFCSHCGAPAAQESGIRGQGSGQPLPQ